MFIFFLALYLFLPHYFIKIEPHSHINKIREYATHVYFRGSLHESGLSFNPERPVKLNSCLHVQILLKYDKYF